MRKSKVWNKCGLGDKQMDKWEQKLRLKKWSLKLCLNPLLVCEKGHKANGTEKRFKEIRKRHDGLHPTEGKLFMNHSFVTQVHAKKEKVAPGWAMYKERPITDWRKMLGNCLFRGEKREVASQPSDLADRIQLTRLVIDDRMKFWQTELQVTAECTQIGKKLVTEWKRLCYFDWSRTY